MELIFHEVEHGVTVLSLDGGLDVDTAPQLDEALTKLIQVGLARLIVDCRNLNYISSYGIGLLLRVHKRMRERGGDVKLAGLHGFVFDVIHLLHLDRVFAIYPDVGQAQLAFRPDEAADAERMPT